ncbi:8-oxoguanine DNA glycosylase [Mycena rosella]|uniref:DNA-(apurinic or apyrimidinic site) lyase n=1 Tax=Mycena rosella TaxID=1033263 RepID=A0AAD7H1N0_MYCRO|nr:8-oxoguanine DNA glycosylase [Mycena rosella]
MWQSLFLPESRLSLSHTLKCGQSFRWTTVAASPPEYHFCLPDRVVCLKQNPTTLFYRTVLPDPQPSSLQLSLRQAETLVWLNSYFQLDVDLDNLYAEWATRDKAFSSIQARFTGIRMLRQDPWENLISFICSSNNNIGRISIMVQSLCRHYSAPLLSLADPSDSSLQMQYYPFPPASALTAPDVGATLRGLGFGYRAEFIQRTVRMLVETHGTGDAPEKFLVSLRSASTENAREELLKLKEVVPVDTHVHQIAIKYYGLKGSLAAKANMTPKLYEEITTRLGAVWGDYAGWAHSVLFTSNLKAFSSNEVTPTKFKNALPTPPPTPSPLKRKSRPSELPCADDLQSSTLVERVKRRRRLDEDDLT